MRRELFHHNASKVILGGIFLLIFFSIPITNILILLYAINWVVGNPWRSWSWQSRDWLLLLIVSPWILEWVSVLYSTHWEEGLHQIEKRLVLFLIPVITLHAGNNAVTDRAVIFRIATGCTVLVTMYCLVIAAYNFFFRSINLFYWEGLTEPTIFMPAYFSLMINILCIWMVWELISQWNTLGLKHKLINLGLFSYFGIITFLLASKLHAVIFVAIGISGMVLLYRKHLASLKAGLVMIIILAAIGFSLPKSMIIERYGHIDNYTTPSFGADDEEFNELTLRLTIFKCATYIIRENPIFGTGIGDVMADLESVYRRLDFKFGYNNAYDPHNQYLRVCLGTGMVGLALFLATLITVFSRALRARDWLVVSLMIVFCSSFLFESVLEQHNGIMIYAFIHSVVIFGASSKKSIYG